MYEFDPREIKNLSGIFTRIRADKQPGLLPLTLLTDDSTTEDLLVQFYAVPVDALREVLHWDEGRGTSLLLARFIVAIAGRLRRLNELTLIEPAGEIVLARLAKSEGHVADYQHDAMLRTERPLRG